MSLYQGAFLSAFFAASVWILRRGFESLLDDLQRDEREWRKQNGIQ